MGGDDLIAGAGTLDRTPPSANPPSADAGPPLVDPAGGEPVSGARP